MLALEDHRLIDERGLHHRDVVHAEPGREGRRRDERHPDEAGILQPYLGGSARGGLRIAAEPAEHTRGDHQRNDELHHAHAKIAEAGIERERVALLRLREEEADIRHRGGEVAAAKAAQERESEEQEIGRIRILYSKPDADRRDHERPGRQRRP